MNTSQRKSLVVVVAVLLLICSTVVLTLSGLRTARAASANQREDNCTRADTTQAWGTSTNSDLVQNFTWAGDTTSTNLKIVSNQCQINPGTTFLRGVDDYSTTGGSDLLTEFNISDATKTIRVSLLESTSSDSANYYGLRENTSNNRLELVKRTSGGTPAVLCSAAETIAANTKYWMRMDRNGTTLKGKIWQDGTTEPAYQTSCTDGSFNVGLHGMGADESTQNSNQSMHFYCYAAAPAGGVAAACGTSPNPTPTNTQAATNTPTATATSTPPPGPTIPGNPESTLANFHIGLPAMTNISSGQSLLDNNPPILMVWDWNGGGSPSSYPTIDAGLYVPGDRQPDTRFNSGTQTLAWFQANHPDWLEYKCDKSTIAYEFGQTTDIPLDITNSAVRTFLTGLYASYLGATPYRALDMDNFQFTNNNGASGQRCGHWTGAQGSSTWVAQFNATSNDPAYRQADIDWATYMHGWAHTNEPNVAYAGNFSYDFNFAAQSASLEDQFDIIFEEQGLTNPNGGYSLFRDGQWVTKMAALQAYLDLGHGLHIINQYSSSFSGLSDQQILWGMANSLLLNNGAVWTYVCGPQEYGTLLVSPLYAAAQVGTPTDRYSLDGSGAYVRHYTTGLVYVNNSSTATRTISLPANTWKDLRGNVQGTTLTLTPGTAAVLVHV